MNKSTPPAISIALCTYNGIRYLPVQWQSLLEQQMLPDEIIVCDDQSTDGTAELLSQLAATAPFPVRILKNPVRVGSNRNFERALAACTGDLIFVCDQDDCWLPEKIATMTAYMTSHPEAQVAFCDAWVTDEQLHRQPTRFWELVRFTAGAKAIWQSGESLEVLLDGNRMMGCASVIRKTFLPRVLPIPADLPADYIYDGWIAMVAATCQAIHFIDNPLQLYRIHVQQQVGVRQKEAPKAVRLMDRLGRRRTIKLAPFREKQSQLNRINELLSERVPASAPGLRQLSRRLAHYTMRSSLSANRFRRLIPVLRSAQQGNYKRYADASADWYAPYLAILGDLLE